MAKNGFLDVLERALDKYFSYDYEINWDKKNFAVEVSYILEIPDPEDQSTPILFEDVVVFYNPMKSKINQEDYLAQLTYEPKQGLSLEFLNYFAQFLQETADNELDGILDFMATDDEEFTGYWDEVAFENGRSRLEETDFYPYPRY